jgi:hypothetical protein
MRNEAIIHYSGGSDSTLCAALAAEEFDRVHLLTYDRLSFIGAKDYTAQNYQRLCKIYGEKKFVRRVIPIDFLHKKICYGDYFQMAREYRLAVTALAFSKLAMHWCSALYALKHSVKCVADGAVPYMDMYPDQNEAIALGKLKTFFSNFEIQYRNPVYSIHDTVETVLYDKGIMEVPEIRGTDQDKQVYYLEQVILALFIKYYMTTHGKKGYEEKMGSLYENRLAMMTKSIKDLDSDSHLRKFYEVL